MELKNKTAIVTGASKGIGFELIKQLLANGMKVAGWSRTAPDLSDPNFIFVKADVSDTNSVNAAHEETVNKFGQDIHVLVNNAGLGHYGKMDEMPFEEWKQMFDVNIHGIFHCSNTVIPQMKILDEGHIINIGSIAGRTGINGMSGYCGTKHAVTGISHSMYLELRDFGIKVTCIYPGSVKTNFFDKFDMIEANDNMMRPEDVASSIVHCLGTHENYLPVDLEIRPLRPKGKNK